MRQDTEHKTKKEKYNIIDKPKRRGKVIIQVEDETDGMQVVINGIPDFKLIPKQIADSFIAALELQISEYYENKE